MLAIGNHRHKKGVSGSILCHRNRGMLDKCANIWLSGQHVADMSATFPAKPLDLPPLNTTMSSCLQIQALKWYQIVRYHSESLLQQVMSSSLLWFALTAAVNLSSHNSMMQEFNLLQFFHHFWLTGEVWSERRHSLLKSALFNKFLLQILVVGEGSCQPSQRIILFTCYFLCPHHHANKDSTTTTTTTTNCHQRGSSCHRARGEQQPKHRWYPWASWPNAPNSFPAIDCECHSSSYYCQCWW